MTFASHSSYPCRRGFALIVTVVLVAFLVLILVGLAIFTRVETQVATNTDIQARARQNALASLNIAVAQLQRHAGQDRRVSARGELAFAGNEQKNLTAIWDADATYAPGSQPLVWLVSGSETNSPSNTLNEVVDPTILTPDPNDDVILVGANTVEDNAERIIVKKQPIEAPAGSIPGLTTAEPIGHYAYWVGDEGVKASLSLVDPSRASAPTPNYVGTSDWTNPLVRERLSMQMLPQPQLQNFIPSIGFADIRDSDTVDGLAKVTSLPALRFVDGFAPTTATPGAQRLREVFHDITPRAEAVLADLATGDGRLKRDLSDPDPAVRPTSINAFLTALPAAVTPYSAEFNVGPTIYPVIVDARVRVSFYLDGENVRMGYLVEAELWNPYAHSIRVPNSGDMTIKVRGLPIDVDITTDATTPPDPAPLTNINLDLALGGGEIELDFDPGAGDDGLWEPGETKFITTATTLLRVTNTPSPVISSFTAAGGTGVTSIDVSVSAVTALEVTLNIGGNDVATYEPGHNFSATSVPTGATDPGSYAIGYAFELVDSPAYWASTNDPRDPSLPPFSATNGAFIDLDDTTASHWSDDPTANAVGAFSTSASTVFRELGSPVALFDLPRQETISVGELRHLISGGAPYRANTNLYDEYFFSTVPQAGWSVDDIETQPLPNRYLRLIRPLQRAAATNAELAGNGAENARFFLQTGAFNINSTSVNAWRAMLGARIFGWAYDNGGGATADLQHAFFRLPHGAQFFDNPPLLTTAIGDAENVVYVGGRELTPGEIDLLAQNIVARIENRGRLITGRPAFTLRDFINSNIITDAINDVAAASGVDLINEGLAADRAGTPGQLTQGDILAALAPVITSRSDTFLVRAYGDVFNPITERVEGQAWCEAVVQRVPDLAEDLGATDADVADPVFSATTNPFGRKFIITSFRWLTPSDI